MIEYDNETPWLWVSRPAVWTSKVMFWRDKKGQQDRAFHSACATEFTRLTKIKLQPGECRRIKFLIVEDV